MKILGMGWIEFVIILAIILIIFGPKQLPKLGRAIGKTVKNLKDGIGSDKDDAAVDEATTEAPAAAASASAASEAQIVSVEGELPAPVPASAASASQAASAPAPGVVKKTVVKKKVV